MNAPSKIISIDVAAADIGFFSTKVASNGNGRLNTISFPSQCSRVNGPQFVSAGMTSLAGINILVGDVSYFVGPDSALQAKGRESRMISENFVNTPEYIALFKGALHYILRDHAKSIKGAEQVNIRRLVVGLPLNTYNEKQTEVRQLFESVHQIPAPDHDGTIDVHVKSVTVIPQPQGAMINSGAKLHKDQMADYYSQNLLIIDLGGGTCDWLLSNDRRVISSRSGAYQKGVLACVFAICESINKNLATDALVTQRIDKAIRENKESFKLNGVDYKVSDFKDQINHILSECLNQVFTSVGSLTSVDQIIFTGGGGTLLSNLAHEIWSEYRKVMVVDKDPVFSNVTGFYHLGEILNA